MDLATLFGVEFFSAATRHWVVWVMLAGLVVTLACLYTWIKLDGVVEERELWITALIWASYCVVGICVLGNLSANRHIHEERPSREWVVEGPTELKAYLARNLPKDQAPQEIPTGLLVQSIEFAGAYNVKVSGYIWQRISKELLDSGVEPGVILPEGDVVTFGEPAYRERNSANEEVIGWYFSTTLREPFNYDKYTLDRQYIWIRIWPKGFYKNVVLVPDYKGYPNITLKGTNNKSKAGFTGLDSSIVIERWNITDVFFSYVMTPYTTNFGIDAYSGQDGFPEMYYNISVKRDFADAFFANIIPPTVVIVLAFMGLLLSNRVQEVFERHGTVTSAMLAYYGVLFFIPITSQVAMRREINAQGATFLDFFYFASYVALLLVSLNSILINSSVQWKWLTWRDNLLPKVTFLPIVASLLLAAAIMIYY